MQYSFYQVAVAWFLLGMVAVARGQQPGVEVPASQPATSAPASQPAKEFQNLPKELTLDLGRGIKMEFVLIPAGEFLMGSSEEEQIKVQKELAEHNKKMVGFPGKRSLKNEGPQHLVKITKPFYMGKYEVTQQQWEMVAGCYNGAHILFSRQCKNLPVGSISWNDTQVFCNKFSALTGRKARLPSEAEWEYACRAGTTTRFSYGDDPDYSQLGDYAWFQGNKGGFHPIGLKKPNAWGLYDMHGSQAEWCLDDWHPSYDDAPADEKPWYTDKSQTIDDPDDKDPLHPAGNSKEPKGVLRGASWWGLGGQCRSAYRNKCYKGVGGDFSDGMRIVIEIPDSP